MFSPRAPTDTALKDLVREQASCGVFSYPEVGATVGPLPAGYRHDRWQIDLGPDIEDRFGRAADAVKSWQPQRGAGLRVFPERPVERGATFALVIRIAFVYVTVAARVVYVVDEPDRSGFAYGTLRTHPECGEESFIVVRDDGKVRFEVASFSRPHHTLVRIVAPVTRLFQIRVTRSYLRAMQRATAVGEPPRRGP